MTEPACAWTAALAALEADVDALDEALSDGRTVVVSSWQPPSDLGPVPDVLTRRAEKLVQRIAAVQHRGRERMGELSTELGQLDRRRDAGVAYSSAGPREAG